VRERVAAGDAVAVGEGFGDIGAADEGGIGQIGDAAGDAEDAGEAACGKAEFFGGVFNEGFGFGREVDGVAGGFGVVRGGVAVAGALQSAGGGDACGDDGAGFALWGVEEFGGRDRAHLDDHVDPVHQRAADFALVVFAAAGGAAAGAGGVEQIAAAAGVHGGDQLETGGVGDVGGGAGHGGAAGFEGLAQGFEGGAGEFGEFIKEEDAAMGEGNFAGFGAITPVNST
jgi:hypothetical protein